MRRAVAVGAALMVVIGLVLLYMLTQATNNREMYEQNYARLFTINMVVATCLVVGIAWVGVRLFMRVRQGRFGSRLLLKIATIFALVGVAPGLLIYVVSYQFVSRSIETWFDVKVEGALEAGLGLGRVGLGQFQLDQLADANLADAGEAVAGQRVADGRLVKRGGSLTRRVSGGRHPARQ
jgi:nitrogen fixation/metabolism regulation signal transduction histidine kinase